MAMSKSGAGPDEDRTRFLRLGLIIIEELTQILQDLLHHEIHPNIIFNKVTQKSVKNLNVNQWHIITNARTQGYKKFDITLMYTLLRNVCPNIPSPTQNWGVSNMPLQNEITVGDDIERIRLIRNNVLGHISEAAIPEKEFKIYWSIISDICTRMQTYLKKDYVKMLQERKECTMDSDTESKYMKLIKELAEEEKTTKDLLQKVLAEKDLTSKENLKIEAKDGNKRTFVETLTDVGIDILNEMVKAIDKMTTESEIDQLYESIEEFLKDNTEEIENMDLQKFFKELKEKITSYAIRQTGNSMRILAKFSKFIVRLRKEYRAYVECSRGSLILLMTFSSRKDYDRYKKDLENGEIGKRILQLFLYPPFLASFGLKKEDLVVYLNGRLLTQETALYDTERTNSDEENLECKGMTLLSDSELKADLITQERSDLRSETDKDTDSKALATKKGSSEAPDPNSGESRGLTSEENLKIEAKDGNKRTVVETLTDVGIDILNEMVKAIDHMTSESEIDQLYESIENFFEASKEEIEDMDLPKFLNELKEKITSYAEFRTAIGMKIFAKCLEFIVGLKKDYRAYLECSRGSLILLMTFSSRKDYDRYKKDLENGAIGKRILQLFLYPPFLASFGLKVEDLVVLLNDRLLTQGIASHESVTKGNIPNVDIQYSFQDVIRCHFCETPVPSKHCDICHIHLCEACVGEHLSHTYKEHYIVPFRMQGITSKCQKHSTKTCTNVCVYCNIPICSLCFPSHEHNQHITEDILEFLERKTELMQKNLQELEKLIYPKYREASATTNIPVQRSEVNKHSEKLTSDLNTDLPLAIDKEEDTINPGVTKITQIILELKKLLDANDFSVVSNYKSRNEEFKSLLAQFEITLPTISSREINREKVNQQVGSLSELVTAYPAGRQIADPAITTEEHRGPMKSPGAVSSATPFMDDPRILTDIQTEYKSLRSVMSLSDSELWTCGNDKIMRLYNLQGKLLKSVQTKSGNLTKDIALTRSGDLVYTDYIDRSINLVSDTQIQTLITLRGWIPHGVCITSSGDLLVVMDSDDRKQSKVVHYSGSTEKQSIQWDDQGKPLYTSGPYTKYLSENRNLDICVADFGGCAVVVVSAAGKLRFRYTSPTATQIPLLPIGITTDSQSRILTADWNNHYIHILDQDGQFLRYLDNCGLEYPFGLCVDSRDNLFVTEYHTCKVKKIQYYK